MTKHNPPASPQCSSEVDWVVGWQKPLWRVEEHQCKTWPGDHSAPLAYPTVAIPASRLQDLFRVSLPAWRWTQKPRRSPWRLTIHLKRHYHQACRAGEGVRNRFEQRQQVALKLLWWWHEHGLRWSYRWDWFLWEPSRGNQDHHRIGISREERKRKQR